MQAMPGSGIPDWRRLYELLGDLSACSTVDGALDQLVDEMEEVVPADRGVSVMRMDGLIPYAVRWPSYSDAYIPTFNEYLNRRSPFYYSRPYCILGPTDWSRYRDSVYHNEFNRPLHIGHSLGVGVHDRAAHRWYGVFVHREPAGPAFGPTDVTVLECLRKPLTRMLSLIGRADSPIYRALAEREQAPGCSPLSRREAEVAVLLAGHLTMREIGERMGISPRTVERHALHVYQKLNLAGRRELATVLRKARGRETAPLQPILPTIGPPRPPGR